MIPIGQPYRPAGTLDARSILITTILGTTAGVIGAAFVWLWEWSPIPTLVFITPLIQGAGVGLVMAFAVGRLRMRNPRIVAVVGFACGLLTIVLVHYGHYLHMVSATASELKSEIAQDKSIPEDDRKSLLARLDDDPAAFIDPMLVLKTRHSGFVGSLFLRNEQGVRIKSAEVTGTFLWILWGAEALAVAAIASVIPAAPQPSRSARSAATGAKSSPTCSSCRGLRPLRWSRPCGKIALCESRRRAPPLPPMTAPASSA